MKVTLHTDFASIATHLPVWNELAGGVPFRLWQWAAAWWRHSGSDDAGPPKRFHQLFVLTVADENGHLMAIAPWYRLHTRSGTRVIRFLGDGEVCSDYLTILCRPENEAAATAALADWLTMQQSDSAESAARWDRLEF